MTHVKIECDWAANFSFTWLSAGSGKGNNGVSDLCPGKKKSEGGRFDFLGFSPSPIAAPKETLIEYAWCDSLL